MATLVGAVELQGKSTSHVDDAMDFWTRTTDDPLGFMSSRVPFGPATRYDMAKIIDVAIPELAAAQQVIERINNTNYSLLSQNCLTDTVKVLQAFGVTGIPGGARPSGVTPPKLDTECCYFRLVAFPPGSRREVAEA